MERALRELLTKSGYKFQASGFGSVDIEIPKEEGFGDLATPLAMGLAKVLKKAPRKIAEDIVKTITAADVFEKIEIAGPGFINFTFSKPFLCKQLMQLIRDGEAYLSENVGEGRRVQIEFVSANPTGPLHLGHGRGAAVGSALANLLKEAGYEVEREYYINDAGRQVRLLGLSVFAKYNQLLGIEYPFPEDGYKGDYVEDLARQFLQKYKQQFAESAFDEVYDVVVDFAYQKMLEGIKEDLKDFGVPFDTWQSERELFNSGEVEQSISALRQSDYIYEKDRATWFLSTAFGDDKDRVIIKNDGEYTYFASDIAYHRKKVEKGYDEIVDIWGADHHGYIQRMQAVIEALGFPRGSLKILLVQMVTLLRSGKPVLMSKRAGEFITLREVIDEIGPDTTKFLFLTRRPDSHLEIDIDVAKAQSQENPVFYVQYVHARIESIFEKARHDDELPNRVLSAAQDGASFDGSLLNEEEMRITKKLLLYPMVFRNSAIAREPHRITFYLQELAGSFHSYYQKYRVITDDHELTKARLALCQAIKIVVRHGLKILGVTAPEKMVRL